MPLQTHVKRDDSLCDAEEVRMVTDAADGEVFLYDGDALLFMDRALGAYDTVATELVLERTTTLLSEVDRLRV